MTRIAKSFLSHDEVYYVWPPIEQHEDGSLEEAVERWPVDLVEARNPEIAAGRWALTWQGWQEKGPNETVIVYVARKHEVPLHAHAFSLASKVGDLGQRMISVNRLNVDVIIPV